MDRRRPLLRCLRCLLLLCCGWLPLAPVSADPSPVADAAGRQFAAGDVPGALARLEAHLVRHPDDRDAWVRLGEIQRKRCALDAARAIYDALLASDLLDPEALAGHAEIDLLLGAPQTALGRAALALSTARGRRSPAAWRARTMALVDLGRYDAAFESGRRGVRVAPDDPRMLEAFARAAFRAGDMAYARELYERATRLDPRSEEAHVRLGSGFGGEVAGRAWTSTRDADLFDLAVRAWETADLAAADLHFEALVRRDPGCFKYRLGRGLVLRALRRSHELRFGGDVSAAFLGLPAPEIPEIDAYVPGHDTLPPWAARVIAISVAPARHWIPQLLERDARHDVLRLGDNLADGEGRTSLRTRRTFDGRRYAHLRGVGGRHAATGIEKLREASQLAFNTFAHEFAHQVLRFAFPDALVLEVKRLYRRARREGRCLDYYAASNVDEYFAQGYEALVSHAKRGCLRDTARHTREELRLRDPELYAFLVEHMDLSHEDETALAAFHAALPP